MRECASILGITGTSLMLVAMILWACVGPTRAIADSLTESEKTALQKIGAGADVITAGADVLITSKKAQGWYQERMFDRTMASTRIDPLTGKIPAADQERLATQFVSGTNAQQAAKRLEESRALKFTKAIGDANTLYETANDWGKSIAEHGLSSPKPYASLVGNASLVLVAEFVPVAGPILAIAYGDEIKAFSAGLVEGASDLVGKGIDAYFDWKDERMMEQIAQQARASDYRATLPDPRPWGSTGPSAPTSPALGSTPTVDRPPTGPGRSDTGPLLPPHPSPTLGPPPSYAPPPQAGAPKPSPAPTAQVPRAAPSAPRTTAPPAPPPSPARWVEQPPKGWVPCKCPKEHAGRGKYYSGTLYHPDGLRCK